MAYAKDRHLIGGRPCGGAAGFARLAGGGGGHGSRRRSRKRPAGGDTRQAKDAGRRSDGRRPAPVEWSGSHPADSQAPATKVLVLSSYGDDDSVQGLMDAGAAGYLIKQTAANDLLRGIREVQHGNCFFSPSVAKRLRDRSPDPLAGGQTARRPGELTSREAEVLQLIAEGFSNKQIAGELIISIKTVEKHRQQVMNKLN